MSEILKPIILNETGIRIASALEAIALNGAGQASDVQNWKAVQNLVRAGFGSKAFPVGTQFIVEKESSMTAAMGTHTGITGVSVVEETFLAAEGIVGSGVHEFIFDGAAWLYHGDPIRLSDFGLSVTGTAADGDEIIVTEAFDKVVMDVVDHRTIVDPVTGESKPGMVLLMHHCYNGVAVDAAEALVYCPNGLAAGAYSFTVKNQAWYTADNDKDYYFTLTQAVPEGGQLVLAITHNAAMEGKSIKSYASATSTDVIETATLSATPIAGATSLGNTDGQSENVNHMHRAIMGSNNYKESAIRQWINSKAPKNTWWTPTNVFDRPVGYTTSHGLLHGMDSDFLAVVGTVTVPCKTNNTFELSGWTLNTAYTVKDKFFLPSRDELGYGYENVAEGSVFKLYDGVDNVQCIKYDIAAQTTARGWWHRSPIPSYAYGVRYTVASTGAVYGNNASYGNAAAAACIIF